MRWENITLRVHWRRGGQGETLATIYAALSLQGNFLNFRKSEKANGRQRTDVRKEGGVPYRFETSSHYTSPNCTADGLLIASLYTGPFNTFSDVAPTDMDSRE